MKLAFVFAQFGPYHHARLLAVQAHPGFTAIPVQLADRTTTYLWENRVKPAKGLVTLFPGRDVETLKVSEVFLRTYGFLREVKPDVIFVPSYWPASSLAVFLAAKIMRIPAIMMNESHAGTAKASGIRYFVKKHLVRSFFGALVGGRPHVRYFSRLGMPARNIRTGYDVVDNGYFGTEAARARSLGREHYKLPPRYFLNVGRMVDKKNLDVLVRAYAAFVKAAGEAKHELLFVGSGAKEAELKALAVSLGLEVKEPGSRYSGPAVRFFGFKQIDETPAIFAFADAFVLPSKEEEWGLVVNEAMASGIPVIVSTVAGCAEDLVPNCEKESDGLFVGDSGWLFEPASVEALARVLSIVAKDDLVRAAKGHEAQRVIENYGVSAFSRACIELSELVEENR